MTVAAFDSKEYSRSTKTQLKFYTPLGVGVKFSDPAEAAKSYTDSLENLAPRFGIENCCGAFSPSEQYRKLGPSKTLKLSDELLQKVQDQIELAYFTYVVLPPTVTPTINVGGYSSPSVPLPTFDFLKRVSVYFSYITAWSYIGIEDRVKDEIILDGFRGIPNRQETIRIQETP
ncbi:MAG: hypothetical protein ABIJ47_06095 [Candidatus Bathyarchaeota archaeon]